MPITPRSILPHLVIGVLAVGVAVTPSAFAESLVHALTEGKLLADLQYRFERVDQRGFAEQAEASTLRLRMGYRTESYHGLFALAGFEHIEALGGEKYNSTANGKTQLPTAADPEGTEINQAYLGYEAPWQAELRAGRQRVRIGNQRFVGPVAWRQNEQTYDGVTLRTKGKGQGRPSLFIAHLTNANRIFGAYNPNPRLADLDISAELFNLSGEIPGGRLTGYMYLLELQDTPTLSQRTFGIRFSGKQSLRSNLDLTYSAEYADQQDYEDGSSIVDATYKLGELGVRFRDLDVKLGYEVLGGNGDYGFATPLATLHLFNGWADIFLNTPADGLKDLFLQLSYKHSGYKFIVALHDYTADHGSADLGKELNARVVKRFKGLFGCRLTYATYQAASGDIARADTDKVWLDGWLRF